MGDKQMIEADFERLLRNYPDTLHTRSRFSGLIKDFFPDRQMSANLLLTAYDLGIAAEIEKSGTMNNSFAYRFIKRLTGEYGISLENAEWAVTTWCFCYGHNILGKALEINFRPDDTAAPNKFEEKTGISQYGELFRYEQSSTGNGLAVVGFSGSSDKMIIFQNKSKGSPVVEIKDGAFSENPIEEAIMTEGFMRIGNKAFLNCTALRQIILPASLRELGDYALCGCKEIKSISLPDGLERIGEYALASTGLRTVKIPKSVYWIGEGAFSDCKWLDGIEINDNTECLPVKLFKGCISLKKVKLNEHLSAVGDYAFADCSSLESVYIPEGVKSIGDNTFSSIADKIVLMCCYGSYAEKYARNKKMKYQFV